MTPDQIDGLTSPLLQTGVIGVVCVALGWIAWKLWLKLESERAAHKLEVAAKDALIKELYDARVDEAKAGYEVVKSNDKMLEAFLIAINGKASK